LAQTQLCIYCDEMPAVTRTIRKPAKTVVKASSSSKTLAASGKRRRPNGGLLPVVISGSGGLEAEIRQEPAGHVKVVIRKAGKQAEAHQLTWQDVLKGLSAKSPSLRALLSKTLQEIPFDAFFWECPPVSFATRGTRPFEFVALRRHGDAGVLEADETAFSQHLNPHRGKPMSKAFPNLGGDCMLIVPVPALKDVQAYAHIASFFRGAPPKQLDQQWLTLGRALNKRLREVGPYTNVWLSTEGTGVHWLHMRLDSRPKYYHYGAYRDPDHGLDESSSESDDSGSEACESGSEACESSSES